MAVSLRVWKFMLYGLRSRKCYMFLTPTENLHGWLVSCGYAKHRNDYLLGDRVCKCVTHSDVNFWPRTWRVWVWVSCRPWKLRAAILVLVVVWKYFKLWEVWILLLWWCVGHNSAAGECKELLQVKVRRWHHVYSGLLDVARSFFTWLSWWLSSRFLAL